MKRSIPQVSSAPQFQPDSLTRLVLNLELTFHWFGNSDQCWFRRQSARGDEWVVLDAQSGEQTIVTEPPGAATIARDPELSVSPDGQLAVFRRDHDLWLRHLHSVTESRITHDGQPQFQYGEVDPSYDRDEVGRRRKHQRMPLRGVLWSPDSRFVVALRQDLRSHPNRLFVTEYTPPDEAFAHAHFRRLTIASDVCTPNSHVIAYDTRSSSLKTLALSPQALNDLALHYFIEGVVWWNLRDRSLFLITANRGGRRVTLLSVQLTTGVVTEILQEVAQFNVRLNPWDFARPSVHVTPDGAELIWYSERSGHGHLYLHNARTGALKRQLTQGAWVVFDLVRVDTDNRLAYFTAAGRSEDAHPYYRYLYRVGLDEGEPQLLTPEVADHHFNNILFRGAYRFDGDGTAPPQPGSSMSPSGRYIVDSYSTHSTPPQYVLRRSDGELIATFLAADASRLNASGWKPPQPIRVKAADGLTDLYGVMTLPRDFDPTVKYPVINAIYPGPQRSSAPRSFVEQLVFGPAYTAQTFADAGFIVVTIDGRGTAHRSRAFREAFLHTEDVFGAADQVAALHHLGAQYPYLDLTRVGIMGQSFGGYGALRAMLLFPDFFKVGVCATGPAGFLEAEGQTNVERFFGVPTNSEAERLHYLALSNVRLASRLRGQLLLIYGGIDESVPLKHAFMMVEAFIQADKDIDMLIVPDASHAVAREPYVVRRTVQSFMNHLSNIRTAAAREVS